MKEVKEIKELKTYVSPTLTFYTVSNDFLMWSTDRDNEGNDRIIEDDYGDEIIG